MSLDELLAGPFDEEVCRYWLENKNSGSRRQLCQVFLQGDNKEENARTLFQYAWDNIWSEEIPMVEMVGGQKIIEDVGTTVYMALKLNPGNPGSLIEKVFSDYGKLDENKCKIFIERSDLSSRKRLSHTFLIGEHKQQNAKKLIQYAWDNIWSEEIPSVEMIRDEEIKSSIGHGVYHVLGVTKGHPSSLLAKVFPDYGKLDENKCEIFIEESDKSSRISLSKAFFNGEDKEKNAKTLIRYAWDNIWSEKTLLVELVRNKDIKSSTGSTVFLALGEKPGNPSSLLAKVFPDYGKLDENKCKIFIEESDNSSRKSLSKAFFSGDHKQKNAKKLIQYAWDNIWSKEIPLVELIRTEDIKNNVGDGVYKSCGVNGHNSHSLLTKVFPDYGKLDENKSSILVDAYESLSHIGKINSEFFSNPETLQSNTQHYLQAYQRKHNKRLVDLVDEDYQKMPTAVSEFHHQNRPLPRRGDVTYNSIQISWDTTLRQTLTQLHQEHGDDIFQDEQLLWDELGVTSFSAKVEAGNLNLIPKIEWGQAPVDRLPNYSFIQYDQSLNDYELQAFHIENLDEINVESFSTPVNDAGFHVQLPIYYKGIEMNRYSQREQLVMNMVATYLVDAGSFTKTRDHKNLPCFNAPEELSRPHCLVPIKGEEPLTKIYLPKQYSADPGIFSSVLNHDDVQVFMFYNTLIGELT